MEHENGDDAADNTDAADNSSVAPSAVSGSRPIPESSATGQGIHRNASDLLDAVAHLEERNVVLCVGLMRTGLKTLHKALRNMGYSKIYDQEDIVSTYELWDDVLRNKATKATYAQIFKDSEVIMGMPTFCFWEQIVELYPGAQVILTVRNEDEWWESVQRAKTLMDKDLPGAPLQYGSVMKYLESLLMPSYHKFCEVLRFSWAATLGAQALEGRELNEVAARGSYRRHNQYVQALLADHTTPSGRPRLLVYDVREGWDRLAEFLGSDKPQVEFPSAMEVPYFPGHHEGGSEKTKRTREEKPARLVDGGQELEALWSPDSDLGGRMRKELRRGLALFFAAFACILAVVVVMLRLTRIAQLPLAFFVILYLAIATIGWNAYVVVHGLVMRVPALVVLPMALKSLLIASCLHICFISYGILKEKLVTQDHIASPLLVCASRLIAVVLGASILLVTEGRIMLGAPMQSLLAFVCTNEASTWAGYEMLRYVSFPVQVMAKSCKLFPNMVMGRILHKQRYEPQQYVQAIAALVCVIIMHMSDETDQNALGGSSSSSHSSLGNAFMGVLFLSFFFVCDSFTSQWQTRLYKQHPTLTQNQLMFGGNLLGLVLTTGRRKHVMQAR